MQANESNISLRGKSSDELEKIMNDSLSVVVVAIFSCALIDLRINCDGVVAQVSLPQAQFCSWIHACMVECMCVWMDRWVMGECMHVL